MVIDIDVDAEENIFNIIPHPYIVYPLSHSNPSDAMVGWIKMERY